MFVSCVIIEDKIDITLTRRRLFISSFQHFRVVKPLQDRHVPSLSININGQTTSNYNITMSHFSHLNGIRVVQLVLHGTTDLPEKPNLLLSDG